MTSSLARPTVLVVEDDEDIRSSVAQVLEDSGYAAVGAANGERALEALRTGPRPCVVLLDVMMPVMDGHAFMDVVKKDPALSQIPVVAMTASGDMPPGTTGFLKKPVQAKVLVTTVAHHASASERKR